MPSSVRKRHKWGNWAVSQYSTLVDIIPNWACLELFVHLSLSCSLCSLEQHCNTSRVPRAEIRPWCDRATSLTNIKWIEWIASSVCNKCARLLFPKILAEGLKDATIDGWWKVIAETELVNFLAPTKCVIRDCIFLPLKCYGGDRPLDVSHSVADHWGYRFEWRKMGLRSISKQFI
jgi:hypothetical protein